MADPVTVIHADCVLVCLSFSETFVPIQILDAEDDELAPVFVSVLALLVTGSLNVPTE